MDIASLCTGPTPSPDELAVVAEFVRATNAGESQRLVAQFSPDAQVNDQLRNFWGIDEIAAWIAREIIGEQARLNAMSLRKHYDVIILNAEITGNFETPRVSHPMIFDLYFTVQDTRIIRLLILLVRQDGPEPEIRRAV